MDKPLQEAILTSIVGMSTVFLILFIIVVSAYFLLIVLQRTNFIFNKQDQVESDRTLHMNIIQAAISKWSGGQAEVEDVKEIDVKA